jgi:trimeric autotransporter adhesin
MPSASSYENAVESLYVAYFGRPADYFGLTNFETALAAADAPTTLTGLQAAYSTNTAVAALVDSFGTSAASVALYGEVNTQSSALSFVSSIYENGFNDAPSEAGLTFYINSIVAGGTSLGDAALQIVAGAGTADAATLAGKVNAAEAFLADSTTVSGGTLELQNPNSAGSGAIIFASGTSSTLQIDGTVMPANEIAGFAAGDTIALPDLPFNSVSYSDAAGILTLLDNGTTVGLLNVAIPYPQDLFIISPDGSGDELMVLPAGSGYSISDTGGAIIAPASTGFNLAGGADTVTLSSGDYLGLLSGVGYQVSGTGDTLATLGNVNLNLGGGSDTVALGGSGDYLGLVSGVGYQIAGTGDTLATLGNVNLNLAGGSDTVALGGSGDYLGLVSGAGYQVTGTGDTVATMGNVNLNLAGGSDTVTLGGSGDYLGLLGGSGYSVTGSGDTLATWANTSFSLVGGGNDLTLASGDHLTVSGGNGLGADTVVGFSEGSTFLSFPGENASNEASVVASAQLVNGNTVLTLPDQTSLVLVGVTHVDTGIFA